VTWYHYLDESGDPGFDDSASSSSHFVLAIVRLADSAPLLEFAAIRRTLYLLPRFEFKYHAARPHQKVAFFDGIRTVAFQVRVAVFNKVDLAQQFTGRSGTDFVAELVVRLVLRANEGDIKDDVLIVDGGTSAFCRTLRIRFSEECQQRGRNRPFKKIVGGKSANEDGLQLADMIAGAVRHHVMGVKSDYYSSFANRVVDLWHMPTSGNKTPPTILS
jgi:hypothetical protein